MHPRLHGIRLNGTCCGQIQCIIGPVWSCSETWVYPLAEVLLRYENENASYTFWCLCTKFLYTFSVSKCSCITAVTCKLQRCQCLLQSPRECSLRWIRHWRKSAARCPKTGSKLLYFMQAHRKRVTELWLMTLTSLLHSALKSRLRVTQGHCKRNHWTDHTRLSSRVIWRWMLLWPWNVA